jgi:hypothetical protein
MARPAAVPADVRARVSAAADVSEKTLRRYLAGVSVTASTLRRIGAALAAEGREDLIEGRAAKVREQSTKRAAA